jgi:hypothetical protein
MNPSLAEPATIVLLCLVGGFIVGLHITLFGLLRGDTRVRAEAAKWAAAVGGGRQARMAQDTQMAELRRAVEQLKTPPKPPQDTPHA